MLTAEIIRTQFWGPRRKQGFTWLWRQRNGALPRIALYLSYSPQRREFTVSVVEKARSHADWRNSSQPMPADLVDILRQQLPPNTLARCAAASIALNRSFPDA